MRVTVSAFPNGGPIPPELAMGIPADEGHATFGKNRSPQIRWDDAPSGTKSFAVICVDLDAPSARDDANQEDRTVPFDLPRADFYHWVLVDISADVSQLAEGADSDGVTPHGKAFGKADHGVRGINDYTGWFDGEVSMEGEYGGYDGPFPPWNDERVHRYRFTVYALDVDSLDASGPFTGGDAVAAMQGHVLDQAEYHGTYTLNPAARA